MIKRIYFLTAEIIPFAETYNLASFSKEIPVVFNERKYDFRLMMPKYSFISERRYILREVIRLREMDLNYRGEQIKASVKSAFIPNTKVQVYFLEHPYFYNNADNDLYPIKGESSANLNSVRFGYFAAAALVTLNYLRWKPEVIICNDWQMSLIPLLIQSNLLDKEYFNGVKILQIVHSKAPYSNFELNEYQAIGLNPADLKNNVDGHVDVLAAAIPVCDHVLVINKGENLLEKYQKDPLFGEIIKQDRKKFSSYELKGESPEDWQNLADEIVNIMERL
jgi:starch synthase